MSDTVDKSFAGLDRKARELASWGITRPVAAPSKLSVLPPSPSELARPLEGTQEFSQLHDVLSAKVGSDGHAARYLSDTLKRVGYYHDVLSGRETKRLW